jgi:hypothetical protein
MSDDVRALLAATTIAKHPVMTADIIDAIGDAQPLRDSIFGFGKVGF